MNKVRWVFFKSVETKLSFVVEEVEITKTQIYDDGGFVGRPFSFQYKNCKLIAGYLLTFL